jgi:undecaprenyl-diphosphatase
VRTPTSRVSVPLALLAVACAAGLLVLAAVVGRQGSVGFDEPAISFVAGLGVVPEAWRVVTNLGAGVVLVPVGIGLVSWLLLRRRMATALIVGTALIAASLGTDVLKELVARPRPPGEPLVPVGGFSFPSGHAVNSTVAFGIAALITARSGLALPARRVVTALLVLVPFLVGLSRIGLGAHFPTDVVAGWLAGIAVVAAVGAVTLRASGGGPGRRGGDPCPGQPVSPAAPLRAPDRETDPPAISSHG